MTRDNMDQYLKNKNSDCNAGELSADAMTAVMGYYAHRDFLEHNRPLPWWMADFEQNQAVEYWEDCDGLPDSVPNHIKETFLWGGAGLRPPWLYDTYSNDEGSLDLDAIWADVKTIDHEVGKIVAVWEFRDNFGSYCSAEKATDSAFDDAPEITNPWNYNGRMCQPHEPQNLVAVPGGGFAVGVVGGA